MNYLPQDVWNIVLQFKKDMELLENTSDTNRFLCHNLLPCYTKYMLDTLLENIYEFPPYMLYDYLEARAVYRERLAVWGIYEAVPPPDPFPMLL
jgi:hypothetical protein